MPMEAARCPQCGAPVGGMNHNLAPGDCIVANLEEEFERPMYL